MAGKKTAFKVKWLDNNSWSTWLENSGNFICLESCNHVFHCIGRIHVRRTDKVGAEAAFHSIDEYMMHVENYYETLETHEQVDRRRVYIATDDTSVISDTKRR